MELSEKNQGSLSEKKIKTENLNSLQNDIMYVSSADQLLSFSQNADI